MHKSLTVLALGIVAALAPGSTLAVVTSSTPEARLYPDGWANQTAGNAILLVETTPTVVDDALDALGAPYDLFLGADFSGVALGGYDHVFVAMDGGLVEAPSIQNAADYAASGGCLHFYGGTALSPYANAMNQLLLENDTANYTWTIPGTPHSLIFNAVHYLSQGLPGSYNFVDPSAAFYQLRSTDAAANVAAMNGDGYDHLLSKTIGSGNFDICMNSPLDAYYTNLADFDWLKQVVSNMLACGTGPVSVDDSSWGGIKALYNK